MEHNNSSCTAFIIPTTGYPLCMLRLLLYSFHNICQIAVKHQRLDTPFLRTYNTFESAGMAEMADAADLKSAGEILVGSSPSPGTRLVNTRG